LDEDIILRIGYNEADLPPSYIGLPRVLSSGLPSISFGTFDPQELSQSVWDYVRYTVSQSASERRIAPHHDVLNQRNVMTSPEHLFTSIPHNHTNYWSSSTGIPPQTDPDFLEDAGLIAFTLLNEGTPLVVQTQTYEVRDPQVVTVSMSALNSPEDLLNDDRDFTFNDDRTVFSLAVPDNVLYNSLEVLEKSTGSKSLIAPVGDDFPQLGTLRFQNKVCAVYDGQALPEESTPAWSLLSDDPTHVSTNALYGNLTYGTDTTGTRTVYHSATPLVNSPGMPTEVTFRAKIASDTSNGLGDTLARFGLNGLGIAVSISFVTSEIGERYVLISDQASGNVLAGIRFDYLDDLYHDYKVVRDPTRQVLRLEVEPDVADRFKIVRISDVGQLADSITVVAPLAEVSSIVDSISTEVTIGRILGDTVAALDTVLYEKQRLISDSVAATDTITTTKQFDRILSDSQIVNDSLAITIERASSDTISAAEDITSELSTVYFDWGRVIALSGNGQNPSLARSLQNPIGISHFALNKLTAFKSGKVTR
jgi:hypothetical protein